MSARKHALVGHFHYRVKGKSLSKHHYDHIRTNYEFHDLVIRKGKLSWVLATAMLAVYFVYILVIGFFPQWLGTPISDETVITWGLPVGMFVILLTFAITGIYVHQANTQFDALIKSVVDASHAHVGRMVATGNGTAAGEYEDTAS